MSIQVTVKGSELTRWLNEAAQKHERTAASAEASYALCASRDSQEARTCLDWRDEHRAKAKRAAFVADHLISTREYSVSIQELDDLAITEFYKRDKAEPVTGANEMAV